LKIPCIFSKLSRYKHQDFKEKKILIMNSWRDLRKIYQIIPAYQSQKTAMTPIRAISQFLFLFLLLADEV